MGTPIAHERSLGRKLLNCAKVGQSNLSITENVILSLLSLSLSVEEKVCFETNSDWRKEYGETFRDIKIL